MTLQLPNTETPSWARELPNGGEGGIRAFQIDGSGLDVKNYMMYRLTLPMGSAPSVRGSVRFKSSLVAFNSSFEGFAARFRGYDANGSEVWDSRPEEKGRRAWRADQTNDWSDAVFVEPVPTDRGIVDITFEILVKAESGLLTLCKPECRYHYSYTLNMDLNGFSSWLGIPEGVYSEQIMNGGLNGEPPITRWVRYVRTEQVNIPKGKYLTGHVVGPLRATTSQSKDISPGFTGSRQIENSFSGFMLKMRIAGTGQYEFITLAVVTASELSSLGFKHDIDNYINYVAPETFDQIEVQAFIQPGPIDVDDDWYVVNGMGGSQRLQFENIKIGLTVSDYLEATQ